MIESFAGHYTADLPTANNRHRLKVYRKFLGWDKVPEGLRVLDIGAPNYVGRELGITDFTEGDLNWRLSPPMGWAYDVKYDVITCFEVMNKLFNHGFFLRGVFDSLEYGGRFYLSVPKLGLIAWEHHRHTTYAELRPFAVRAILEDMGFKILRYEVHSPWPFTFVFYGIRPPFRYLLNRFMLFECEK